MNLVKAQGINVTSENLLDDDKTFNSKVKVHTCCSLDLTLEETSCKTFTGKDRPKSWTFPQHMMAENISTVFSLEIHKLPCQSEARTVYLPMQPRGTGAQKLLKNGYLKVLTEYYPPAEYCISAKNETDLEIKVCPRECKGDRPCIQKCCSLDKVYSFGINGAQKGCQVPKGEYFKPIFYDDYTTKSSSVLDPHYIEHYPTTFKYKCPSNQTTFYLFPEATEILNPILQYKFNALVYRIRKDGKISFKHPRDGKCSIVDPTLQHVCIDGVMNYGKHNSSIYINDDTQIVMFVCSLAAAEKVEEKKVVAILYGSVMLLSSIFLLLTILTYIALWERQSVHGWTIVSHTVSLFFMYIFLGIAHIIGVTYGHEYLGSPGCIGIGIVTHFFFLATFCWLLLISVDLWLTFRAFTPRSGSKGISRFIKYSIFGWGVPMIFVVIGIILEDKYPEGDCHTLLTPAYGRDSCFPQQKALGVYLYYPIAVMIGLVVVFFAITTAKLYLYRQSTKMATKDDKHQQFYRLFVKLIFVMGVTWIFEVISWAASGNGYHWYWVVFDLMNVLRALAVFLIFVCKPDIILALEGKYPCLKPIILPFAWIVRRRHSGQGGRDNESVGFNNSSMITRSSTLRQTVSSDSKPEAIGLVSNSVQAN
ncbi:G-protein coupled receptor Mth2 [Orchesella cincta]|uniref:G-protein coupled receptor Mth2 n=1 Tax=Orchesella cincta TaxID=48709 RepID=A0A1D2M9R4_ORCCI|nr:G-protein coupled receptor Mth2 [Orchesella cincta]